MYVNMYVCVYKCMYMLSYVLYIFVHMSTFVCMYNKYTYTYSICYFVFGEVIMYIMETSIEYDNRGSEYSTTCVMSLILTHWMDYSLNSCNKYQIIFLMYCCIDGFVYLP